MFQTKIDCLENYDGAALVIMLGDCDPGPEVSPDKIIRFPDADAASLSVIRRLNPALLRDGLTLLVSSRLAQDAFPIVRRIQKHLVFTYAKYVWFPKQDTSTPDPFALGHDKGPLAGLVYQLNTLMNLPYLMASSRTKAIARTGVSLPTLALSPGPSLTGLRPHLTMLAERFVIICISRSLEFCHSCGVTPDVVVQLDTHPEQAVFYLPDMDFSRSWLFMLSCAPVTQYAQRFAGTFAIDTFFPQAFSDAYDMRCSWLSSLIPTLGAMELFSPATALLAGADLSFSQAKYFNADALHEAPIDASGFDRGAEISAVTQGDFPVRLADGSVGKTSLQYMATAYEAETVAWEIRQNRKTAFFNVTRSGILDQEIFTPASPEDFLDAPPLDRKALQNVMARASRDRADFDPARVGDFISFHQQNGEMLLPQARIIASSDADQSQSAAQLLSAGKLITFLHPVPSPKDHMHLCLRVVEKYREAAVRAHTLLRLDGMASKGQPVAVLGLIDELEALIIRLSKRFPQGAWRPYYTWGTPEKDSWRCLQPRNLPEFISSRPVVLVSERYLEAYGYLFTLLPRDHVLSLNKILAAPWPGHRDNANEA